MQAIEEEVSEWIESSSHFVAGGRCQVVRNGFMPERRLLTGLGEITVKQPWVHDRRPAEER